MVHLFWKRVSLSLPLSVPFSLILSLTLSLTGRNERDGAVVFEAREADALVELDVLHLHGLALAGAPLLRLEEQLIVEPWCVCVCACVCVRERVCVCVCARACERD